MKKLILIPCLLALAGCDMYASHEAANDCSSLHYRPGTPEYEHCKVDMKHAEKMQSHDQEVNDEMSH